MYWEANSCGEVAITELFEYCNVCNIIIIIIIHNVINTDAPLCTYYALVIIIYFCNWVGTECKPQYTQLM